MLAYLFIYWSIIIIIILVGLEYNWLFTVLICFCMYVQVALNTSLLYDWLLCC